MPDPVSFEAYERLTMENTVIDGFGVDVATHTPCPFCAHPGFMVLMPAAGMMPGDDRPTLHDTLQAEHTCAGCGRSAKVVVERDGGATNMEIVQTGGDDPPEWLNPKPRRVGP